MLISLCRTAVLGLLACSILPQLSAQAISSSTDAGSSSASSTTAAPGITGKPWNLGVLANVGFGTEDRSSYKFFFLGAHAGKILTEPMRRGFLRGQFEYAVEVIPLWQAYTPKFLRANCVLPPQASENWICTGVYPTGGTYTGVSVTPIILRWDLTQGKRWKPWIQGAGGLIWTNHKFPPVGPVPAPGHQGTSVFNFTPQFGIGVHYFVRPRRSIDFAANAVHISSASLGDANPGVNASVQFSVGYSWWR